MTGGTLMYTNSALSVPGGRGRMASRVSIQVQELNLIGGLRP